MVGKKLINQSLVYGLASVLINGSNFFLIPFYTHYLTATEYGIVSGVTVFSTLTTAILAFGLNGAVTRFYFDLSAHEFKSFLFTIFVFQVIAAFTLALLVINFDGLFLDHLYSNIPYQPYLKYGLITGIMGIFSTIPLALLQAQSRAVAYRLFTTASFIILTLMMIVLVIVLRQGSLGGVKAALFAGSSMALAYAFFLLRQTRLSFSVSHLKTALMFSLPLMVYTIFGALMEISSKFFIERFISLAELGIFNVAQQFASVLVLLTNAINMAWTPIFYEEARADESSVSFTMFGKFLIFSLTFLGLTVALFVPEIVESFMSTEYSRATTFVPVLLLAYIIGNGYWILIINPLTYSKKTTVLPLLTIVSGAVAVGLSILLVPQWGGIGATVSTALSYVVLVSLAYVFFRKYSAVRYDFRSMNGIVVIGVVLYCLAILIDLEQFWVTIVVKLFILLSFYFLVRVFGLYSLREILDFTRSTRGK
jgi:O-antigen/teichoic acid export membrane protein